MFLANGQLDQRLVRTEVGNSWQRCRELQLNPLQPRAGGFDDYGLLSERRSRKELLCRIARPFLQDLFAFVRGADYQVILTDESGYLLEVIGDPRIVNRMKEVELCAGADWSEASKGTNAIGTSLVERRPVQIIAWEHYCEQNQILTCSAAPIHDPEGNIAGVLDISGDCRQPCPYALGLVVTTARSIENQFRLENARHRLFLASQYSSALVKYAADGMVAIDRSGTIVDLNAPGGEILGIVPSRARGRHLTSLDGGPLGLLRVLEAGREYLDEDSVIGKIGRRIRTSGTAVRDEAGCVVGAIGVFREIHGATGGIQKAFRPSRLAVPRYCLDDIVAQSAEMKAAKDWAALAASGSSTVLILGESGTGKELFAAAIHGASDRAPYPFVAINCAALPESLIESELFGYVEGSFTGARKGGQAGKFEMAAGGSVFFDEIGDMSLNVQAKLLRVIQERRVARIGSAEEIPVDVRLIAATHRKLEAEIARGAFREDLYYRLNVLEIFVPPLRKRVEDIPELARRLAARIAAKLNRAPVSIEDSFLARLCSYRWPGNVRELENAIERAIVRIGENSSLDASSLHLPGGEPWNSGVAVRREVVPRADLSEIVPLREVERRTIAEALGNCGGNIARTAQLLGICRNTLYRKMQEYGIGSGSRQNRISLPHRINEIRK